MSDEIQEKINIFYLKGKTTLSKLDNLNILEKLDYSIPGNFYAKKELLTIINKKYVNQNANSAATLLTGNDGVGKSSLIKKMGELTNIPVIRLDLENILDTPSEDIEEKIYYQIHEEIYENVLVEDLNQSEKKQYYDYKELLPEKEQEKIIIFKEKYNARFSIIEFDNCDSMLDQEYAEKILQGSQSKRVQSILTRMIKKPTYLVPEQEFRDYSLGTNNFIYIFSGNLNNYLRQKNIGFMKTQNKIDSETLLTLNYSKKFIETIDAVIELKNPNAEEYEKYLLKKESHFYNSIKNLASNYGIKITLDNSAINFVSKYLALNNNKNLHGIEEVTMKLLAPYYLTPITEKEIVINSTIAAERLSK